jgi:hypothetical protein
MCQRVRDDCCNIHQHMYSLSCCAVLCCVAAAAVCSASSFARYSTALWQIILAQSDGSFDSSILSYRISCSLFSANTRQCLCDDCYSIDQHMHPFYLAVLCCCCGCCLFLVVVCNLLLLLLPIWFHLRLKHHNPY